MALSLSQMSMTEVISVKKYLLDLAGGSEAGAQLLWAAMKFADEGTPGVMYSDADMTITYIYLKSLGGTIEIGKNKSSSDIYINQSKNKLKIVPAADEDVGFSQIILQKA